MIAERSAFAETVVKTIVVGDAVSYGRSSGQGKPAGQRHFWVTTSSQV